MSEKCSAKTKLGDECRAGAVTGTKFCALHGDPARAAELGRMGGRRNRHYMDTDPISITPPSTPEDVKNVLAQAMADVRAKKLEPRIATALTYMSRVLLDAFATTDLQKQAGMPSAGSTNEGGQAVTGKRRDRPRNSDTDRLPSSRSVRIQSPLKCLV
jgi:hypothetical protein